MTYEKITAQNQTITIRSGETFENKLIDLGTGGNIMLMAKGSGWTIRNIGFTGTWDHGSHAGRNTLMPVADTGGKTSTIENIYFGDRQPDRGSEYRGKMIWVDPAHSGKLNVRNVHFGIGGANGIYGSAPGWSGSGKRGTVHYDTCYARNNNHTALRCSSNGDSIRNSVIRIDPSAYSNRGIWVWDSPNNVGATLENIMIANGGGATNIAVRGNAKVNRSNITTSQDPTKAKPPDGVPTDAIDAASAGVETEPEPSPPPDLPDGRIEIRGRGFPCHFQLAVEGTVVDDPREGPLGQWGSIHDGVVEGWVTEPTRPKVLAYDGEVIGLTFLEGDADVLVDGTMVRPSDFKGTDPAPDPEPGPAPDPEPDPEPDPGGGYGGGGYGGDPAPDVDPAPDDNVAALAARVDELNHHLSLVEERVERLERNADDTRSMLEQIRDSFSGNND